MPTNNNLVLISGKSATGKSLSLRNIKDPEGVLYMNCENNKDLPFKSGFKEVTITDPLQVYEGLLKVEDMPGKHTVIIDSLTFMMNMYENLHVLTATNTMKAWGEYAQFFQNLMSQYVARSTKNIIFLAHTSDIHNEEEQVNETRVKVKGSLMTTGIESYFTTVISSKKVALKKLEDYDNDMLNITDQEEMLGFKYVYQTMLTRDTVNESIRSPLGMWEPNETFIDNDAQLVLDKLHEYYS